MAKLRTGTVEPRRDRDGKTWYRARIWLADGTRIPKRVPDKYSYSRARAVEWAKAIQEGEDANGKLLAEKRRQAGLADAGETVAEYMERWLDDRVRRGVGERSHDRGRLVNHVLPLLTDVAMVSVTRERLEAVVDDLDRKILLDAEDDEHLSWRTAANVWTLVTKLFDDACNSKRRELRVLKENPAGGVRGPERGIAKAKQYLYPSDFMKLVSCRAVDLRCRVLYAVAVYTYARAGELDALTWDDVDLEHGVIHITKAVDRSTNEVKSTKTGETRRIPIHPELVPLLKSLHKRRTGSRVLWMPLHEYRALLLREHLELAGVQRAELFKTDERRKNITFHDLRATGITWAAVAGEDPLRIKQRAGHSSFSTTEGYIREAENLARGFGAPFPPLPPSLFQATMEATERGSADLAVPKIPIPSECMPEIPAEITQSSMGLRKVRPSNPLLSARAHPATGCARRGCRESQTDVSHPAKNRARSPDRASPIRRRHGCRMRSRLR